MKKTLVIASALLISAVAFGQKKELREAERQIKKGDFSGAKSTLAQVESTATSGEFAAQYYFLQGLLNIESAKKNNNVLTSLQDAAAAFAKVKQIEGGAKGKFTQQILPLEDQGYRLAHAQGQELYTKRDLKNASTAFEQAFRLNSRDTVQLYYSAVTAVEDKNYDLALKHYKELKEINYDGTEMHYYAKDKQTGKEDFFSDKNQRDLMVKGGTHTSPRNEKTPSKRAEIVKNIAYIYVEQGKNDQALEAFAEARRRYPNDATLVMQEAMIYLQLDDKNKFKELMQEAIKLDPKNADLHYNVGVINMEQKNLDEARKAFQEALSIRPDYADAALNISSSYINEGNALGEQMDALKGSSKEVIAKYEELKAKRESVFKKAADVLEDYIKKQTPTQGLLEQLRNIYGALGDHANYQRVKGLLGE